MWSFFYFMSLITCPWRMKGITQKINHISPYSFFNGSKESFPVSGLSDIWQKNVGYVPAQTFVNTN